MKNLKNQIQIRFTDNQLKVLRKAHAHYIRENQEPVHFTQFLRMALMYHCMLEIGMIEKADTNG